MWLEVWNFQSHYPTSREGRGTGDWVNHQQQWFCHVYVMEPPKKAPKHWGFGDLPDWSTHWRMVCPKRAWRLPTSPTPLPLSMYFFHLALPGSCILYNKWVIITKVLFWILWAILAIIKPEERFNIKLSNQFIVRSKSGDLGLLTGIWSGDSLVGLSP